jgi:hypothetical protein
LAKELNKESVIYGNLEAGEKERYYLKIDKDIKGELFILVEGIDEIS